MTNSIETMNKHVEELKVVELFAGIGSQTQALKNIDIEHDVINISEWNISSLISYDAIHTDDKKDYTEELSRSDIIAYLSRFTFSSDGKDPCNINKIREPVLRKLYNAHLRTKNLGNISEIEALPRCDLLTYTFPCQNLSVGGDGAGIKKGTRSGLLLEVERLLDISNKPKYLLMENVKNLLSKNHKPDFDRWCKKLENIGYTNYGNILDAKDFGVPQSRERVFMISILGDHDLYIFPQGFKSDIKLKDVLEDEVEEKYHLSEDAIKYINREHNGRPRFENYPNKLNGLAGTVTANLHKGVPYGIITGDDAGFKPRRLTPLEAWRLMGFSDDNFSKAESAGVSVSQLYMQAGNTVVIPVLEYIFNNLFRGNYNKESE